MHSRFEYHNRNHDILLSCVLSPKTRIQQNECFEMLNNERGICMFRLSTNLSVIMNDSNQLNKIWMSCSSTNQKGMQDYMTFLEGHTFIWSAKTLLKTSNNVLFFAPMFLVLVSKPSECNFVINKINLIIFINATFFMKKIQHSNINSIKYGDLSYKKLFII